MNSGGEVWVDVPGYLCQASSLGRLRQSFDSPRRKAGQPIKQVVGNRGYFKCNVFSGSADEYVRKSVLAHTLICTAFHGPAPVGLVCRFHDNSRDNLVAENLYWGAQRFQQSYEASRRGFGWDRGMWL